MTWFRRKPKPAKEFPYLGSGYKRGTDYQEAPAHHVEIEVPKALLNPRPQSNDARLAEAESLLRSAAVMDVGWIQLDAGMGCPGFQAWKAQALEFLARDVA